MMGQNPGLAEIISLQLALQLLTIVFLVVLLRTLQKYLPRQQFLGFWAWAWMANGLSLAAGFASLQVDRASPNLRNSLVLVSLIAGFSHAALLAAGAVALRRPFALRKLKPILWLAAAAAAGLFLFSRMISPDAFVSYAVRMIPRQTLVALSYLYCAAAFGRYARRMRSWGAGITAGVCALSAGVQLHSPWVLVQRLWFHQAVDSPLTVSLLEISCILMIGVGALRVLLEEHAAAAAERQRAEAALQEFEDRFQIAFRSSPDSISISTLEEGTYLDVNEGFERLSGYRRDEALGKTAQDLRLWANLADRERIIGLALAHGRAEDVPAEFRTRTGEIRSTRLSMKIIELDGRKCILSVVRDETERKKADEALRISEDKFRKMFHSSPNAIVLTTLDEGRYLDVNEKFLRSSGYTREEVIGKSVADLGTWPDPSGRQRMKAALRETGRFHIRTPFRTKSRESRLAELTATLLELDGVPCVLGMLHDVTHQIRAAEALRASEERYRDLFEYANDIIYTHDLEGNFTSFNKAGERITGYSREELLGRNIAELVEPEHMANAREMISRKVQGGRSTVYELHVRAKDGRVLPLEVSTRLMYADGKPVGVEGIARDLTDRHRAEQEIQKAHQQLTFHLENSLLGYIEWHPRFGVRTWSKQAEKIFGFTAEEACGTLVPEAIAEDREAVQALTDRLMKGVEPRNTSANRNLCKDGSIVHCEWYNSALWDSAGNLISVLSLVQDVTERKLLEDQLRQAQKMEAVGQLAGGVAHDFNNLLMIIRGHSELLLERTPSADPVHKSIAEIDRAAERAASLTHQLLAFSRKQVLAPRVLNLNEVVIETEKMLRRLIGENIQLLTRLEPDLWPVKADRGQVEQVLMNLAVNARDAMPRGGRLLIDTANEELDDAYLAQHPGASRGPHVLLSVSDTGDGMDAATQKRIFEPFFTTKERGKGTGLGLATVYGIVKQSGGSIYVYSEVGRGTNFKVYLPQAQEAAAALESKKSRQTHPRGSETILLVEDEKGVRDLTREFLTSSGYTVLEAADGEKAVRRAREFTGPIHLLMTDMVMPGISGRELAEKLLIERPEMKVLFLSGYTSDAVADTRMLACGATFLQKPFTLLNLASKIRETLRSPVGVKV